MAPGAVSALRTLEGVLAPDPATSDPATSKRHNKMIVFGHSLGGNMLATGLKDDLIAQGDGKLVLGKPAAHFLHGFDLSGTAPITQAADPFWNMRAFDNALSRHDGYRLTSFICAMNQLVMDDITEMASPMSNHMSDAPAPQP